MSAIGTTLRAVLSAMRVRRPNGSVRVATALASLVTACWLSLGALSASAASGCGAHPWCNSRLTPSQRASMVVAAMTTAEKLALLSNGSAGVARLGIPALRGIDGPNGVGEGNTHVTAFPDAETIAASWDLGVARAYGQALGAEAAGKGFDWLFAPTINIVRTPLWGREAETLGEDPFLTAAARGAGDPRHPEPACDLTGQALRGQQPGGRSVRSAARKRRGQRPGLRAGTAGDLPARVPRRGAAGACRLGDVLLQPHQHRVFLSGRADTGHAEELRAAGVRRSRCLAGRPRRCRRGQRRASTTSSWAAWPWPPAPTSWRS